MASGVYKLTFKSGNYYIGKTNNFTRRWEEHWTKLNKGTGATRMQAEFNKYKDFRAEILLECHEDHIDILESYYINKFWGPSILNGTRPTCISESEYKDLVRCPELLIVSTSSHCYNIYIREVEINKLRNKVESVEEGYNNRLLEIVDGTALDDAEDLVTELEDNIRELEKELRELKSRNWFSRLFNL